MFWTNFRQKLLAIPSKFRFSVGGNTRSRLLLTAFGIVVIGVLLIGFYWSREPPPFSVAGTTNQRLAQIGNAYVVGSATTVALIFPAETLLVKPGGYRSNDMLPPGVYLVNFPNWELWVLVQIRDLSRSMRESFSRSQSQSTEDVDLIISEPRFHFDNDSWLFPPSESEYREAIGYLNSYLSRISDPQNVDAQFFARADNLASWLLTVESRLGSLSQRLSASVRQRRVNTDTAGERGALQSTPTRAEVRVKTPWLQIDDVFYEARGANWALMHFLRAIEIDFEQVLADKNASASLSKIIREFEASQRSVTLPIILNRSGLGFLANHSLTMTH